MNQIHPEEDERDYEPVLSSCIDCGKTIVICIRGGKVVRLNPGFQKEHRCPKPRLTTHTHDRDVFSPRDA